MGRGERQRSIQGAVVVDDGAGAAEEAGKEAKEEDGAEKSGLTPWPYTYDNLLDRVSALRSSFVPADQG